MSDEQDAKNTGETTPTAPLVVIEYRNRGVPSILVPPLLILLVALAITSHRRVSPLPPARRPTPRPAAPAPIAPSIPLEVRVITAPAPAAAPEPEPEPPPLAPPPESRPIEVAAVARPAIGFSPPAETEAEPPAQAHAPRDALPPREEIWDAIQREAERRQADRDDMEALKPKLKGWEFAEALRKVREARAPFHDDLRRLLKTLGDRAGPEINRLCDRYGRNARPEVQRVVSRNLATTYARVGRVAKVEMMRALGLPEPLILDQLAHELDLRTMNTRGGPRDAHDVRVRAAQLLLTMPMRK